VLTGFIYLRIGTSNGYSEQNNKQYGYLKRRESIDELNNEEESDRWS